MKVIGNWRRAASLTVLAAALGWAPPLGAEPATPLPEQLLAAAIHADDLAKTNPGGWWDDVPEFNHRLEPDPGDDLVDFVMNHVFGRPDDAPAEVATALHLYRKAAAAADAFAATLDADRKDFGETFDGPQIGDQSRYLRQNADSGHEGGLALRFQFGRYLVRIDVGGDASTMPVDQLGALGNTVIERLKRLDGGRLAAANLPDLVKSLPPADATFTPVLGTATVARETWSWIWSNQSSALVVSGRLRALLRDNGRGEPAVMRSYALASSPANVVEVMLLPFRNAEAATHYLAETKREDARRSAIVSNEGDVTVTPPIPDVAPAYRADLRLGRYVAAVTCSAPFAPTSSACENAVKELADKVKAALPAK